MAFDGDIMWVPRDQRDEVRVGGAEVLSQRGVCPLCRAATRSKRNVDNNAARVGYCAVASFIQRHSTVVAER